MKILIIGGNRFVGAEVVSRAVLDGHDVSVVALDPPNIRARSHVRFIRADRNNSQELKSGLKDESFDVVIDNIAFTPDSLSVMLKVLHGKIGRYVLTSTVDIYGRETPCINAERHELLSPSSLKSPPQGERYLRGKRGCEVLLRNSGVSWSIIRPAIVFGRSDPIPPAPRALHPIGRRYGRSYFLPSRVADGGPILLRKNDRRVFRLASAHDVATALLTVANHSDAVGRAFNVAGDEIWSSERLIVELCSISGKVPDVVRVSDNELEAAGLGDYDSPYGRVKWWSVVDNRQLKSLGWAPTPARVELSKLLEAVPVPQNRPFYGRRVQEIALAEQVRRKERNWLLDQSGGVKLKTCAYSRDTESTLKKVEKASIQGEFSSSESEKWRDELVRSRVATPVPHTEHFSDFFGSPLSSIGIGTHRGDASPKTDKMYRESILYALQGGINLVDTAINYRRMRAERTVGQVVRDAASHGISRGSICICSKGGFVPHDADDSRPAEQYIWDEYVVPGLIDMNEAIRRHCIKPEFLKKLLAQSLDNLGVKRIDVYYIHNPERAISWMGPKRFYNVLRDTFAMLEEAVAAGTIGVYGVATWQGFRTHPDNPYYLSVERISAVAQEVAGEKHHFKVVQFPLNILNKEACVRKNQTIAGNELTLLEAANALGLYTCTSASIYRGQELSASATESLAQVGGQLDTTQTALDCVRSVPCVGSALVGMRRKAHVEKALITASYPKMLPANVQELIQ